MLLEITMESDCPLDYSAGIVELKKDYKYIIQDKWSEKLPCQRKEVNINQYNLSIVASNDSILFIRAMGMGDMLFLSPLLSVIKQKYPSCKIGFAAVKSQHQLLDIIPNIDEIIEYPIPKEKFDEYKYHFTVSGLIEGNEKNKEKNIYQIYLQHLGISKDILTKEWYRPIIKSEITKNDELKNTIGIHPFAIDPLRQLNLFIVSDLCTKLISKGYDIVIFSNKKEKEKYQHVFNEKIKWNIDTNNSILSMVKVISSCKVVFSTDSLITHLCQAIGTYCICIYGPFSSYSRIGGYENIIILDNNPECRCFAHQVGKCKKGFKVPPCNLFDTENIIDLIENNNINLEMKSQNPIIKKYNMIVEKENNNEIV